MPIKIKILLGVMTLTAVLIIAGFFINVGNVSGLEANILKILGQTQINKEGANILGLGGELQKSDIDKDGLPDDEEESIWGTDPLNPDTDADGFLDGEEVASGRDPYISGPDDELQSSNANLTQKLATLAISGLHEGSLEPDNPDFDSYMDTLVSSVLNDAFTNLDGGIEQDELDIRTTDSSKSNQEKYTYEFFKIYKEFFKSYSDEMGDFEENLNEVGKSGFGSQKIKEYFGAKASDFEKIFDDLSTLTVPENWKAEHLRSLELVRNLVVINLVIAIGEDDPVKAMVALNRLFETLDTLTEMAESYNVKIEEQGLKK